MQENGQPRLQEEAMNTEVDPLAFGHHAIAYFRYQQAHPPEGFSSLSTESVSEGWFLWKTLED